MPKKRTFISFDFDHDEDLRNLLVGQSQHPDTPFEMTDASVREAMTGNWKEKVRWRIRNCDIMVVLCGEYTSYATGVGVEVSIAQAENVPYFLLWGRNGKACQKPTSARSEDQIYSWTWDNLKALIGGAR